MPHDKPLTYKQAGVDIDAGNALIERIKPLVRTTQRDGALGGLGGFGGLFELDTTRYRNPVLVSGTDGVGTKLKLAIELERYDTIGIDLVAMCVNDVIVQGAEPLFFLDYYATGQLDLDAAEAVISGIAEGCRQAGAALLGGETAELPGLYKAADFDLAGFCVGVVDRDRLIDGTAVAPGDRLLGLASSGAHSNGYSLIRQALKRAPEGAATRWQDGTIGEALLVPTRIYVRSLLGLMASVPVHALAHITGGGLAENLARVLPADADAVIGSDAWEWPELFRWIQSAGSVADAEMLRTFNCGIGMVVCIPADRAAGARAHLEQAGETVFDLGEIQPGDGQVRLT